MRLFAKIFMHVVLTDSSSEVREKHACTEHAWEHLLKLLHYHDKTLFTASPLIRYCYPKCQSARALAAELQTGLQIDLISESSDISDRRSLHFTPHHLPFLSLTSGLV